MGKESAFKLLQVLGSISLCIYFKAVVFESSGFFSVVKRRMPSAPSGCPVTWPSSEAVYNVSTHSFKVSNAEILQ
jgi:hypothetical protein